MEREIKTGISNKLAAILQRWPLLPMVVIWFVVFWPMNSGQTVVGFRDSAYLYYPYFKWIDQQWAAGDVPLWNPYCDDGYPVIGDGSSSVFYPGKLIFLLRIFDYPVRYGWYLSLHVLLAAIGGFSLARRLGADRLGGFLSGFAYAFGGSVLFQVCNVIYLVSAAWLPFGLAAVWSMTKSARLRYSLAAAIAAAMMILGGDPQMAYLLAIIALATSAWNLISRRFRLVRRGLFTATMFRQVKLLAVFAMATAMLASVQILPTYVWARQSSRDLNQADLVALSLEGRGGPELDAVYQFSQPPWTLIELVWPNVSGQPFPVYQRWIDVLPGAERFWTPSLYLGLLTLVVAIGGIRFWGRSRRRIWLSMLLIVFTLGSFGWFGAVWLCREVSFQFDLPLPQETQEFGPYVGGLYWLATIVIPKFVMFRYPAKLFVIASLSLCVLAGLQFRPSHWRIRVGLMALPIALLSALAWILTMANWSPAAMPVGGGDPLSWSILFGPLDWPGARSQVLAAMLQTFIVASALLLLSTRSKWKMSRFAVVMLLVVELLWANIWLVPQVGVDAFESNVPIAKRVQSFQWDEMPMMTAGWNYPPHFASESSEDRLAQLIYWQRENLHPKHHLDLPIALRGSFTSIEPRRRGYETDLSGWGRTNELAPLNYSRFLFFHPSHDFKSSGQIERRTARRSRIY